MNTVFAKLSQACVHGFRAHGLRPRPGMTRFLNFLTASKAGLQTCRWLEQGATAEALGSWVPAFAGMTNTFF